MPSYANANTKDANESSPLFSVSFTNGLLDETRYEDIKTKVYQHRKHDKIRKLVVSAGKMDYVGDFYTSSRLEGKYVGIENTDTQQMTLVPLKRIRLRPAVSLAQEAQDDDYTLTKKSKQEQHDSLIENFGGAKQILNMERKKKHGINDDMIHEALNTAGVETLFVAPSTPSTPSNTADDSEILPPFDALTTNPNESYPLEGYLPEAIRNDMEGFVDDLFVDSQTLAEWRKEKTYPSFVITQLENLPLVESKRKDTAVQIKYLMFLIRLYQLRAADLKQKDPFTAGKETSLYQMPASCFNHLLDTYTVKAARQRSLPHRLKDKALVSILLLALRLERNSFSTKELLADIKVGPKKIVMIAKAMGCKVKMDRKRETPEVIIELLAPLKFPAPSNTPRPRNR